VPYDAGNYIGRHCHTIASGCGEIVYALRPLVSSPGLTAYERRWELCKGVLSNLNRAALTPPAAEARLKAGARAFLRLLQRSFPWKSISANLHVLFAHSCEFIRVWGRTLLYGELAIES